MSKAISLQSIFLTFVFLTLHTFVFSQNPTIKQPKFGKKSPDALVKMAKEKFPDAHAVILYDYGESKYGYSLVNGMVVDFERHVSILFLDNIRYDFATFEIPLINTKTTGESLGKVRGVSYNLEDGEYQKVKLSKKDIITEKFHEQLDIKKFTMPNVKEGTVIEVKYTYSSPFFWVMPDWKFQHSIPILYSEYQIDVPDFFKFNKRYNGFFAPYIKERKKSRYQGNISTVEGWVMTNLPKFKGEDYMRHEKNYVCRIDFELERINYLNGDVEIFLKSWNEISEAMMERESFGEQINNKKTARFIVDQVEGSSDDKELMIQIYELVKKRMKWNNRETLVSYNGIKEAWDNKIGNSGDINLILIAALKEAGFKVNPVVLSTRKNGMLPLGYPTNQHLNYVIAKVNLDGKSYYLDATEDHIPAGTIPDRCLNGDAVILDGKKASPISMQPNAKYKSIIQNKLKLTEDFSLEGEIIKTKQGKAAIYGRGDILDANSIESLVEKMETENEGLTVDNHSFENAENIYEKLKETYTVTIEDKVEEAGDLLYLNPMLFEATTENPFKLEERKYPVDFVYPIEEIYMFELDLPEGYVIESLPEKVNLALPEKSATYSYSAKVVGKKITVLSRMKFKKFLFSETEYGGLKEFFNLIVKSHSEQIVLKKS